MGTVIINYEKCIKDGICADVCPRNLIGFSQKVPVPVPEIDERCIRCGHCLSVCPTGAVSVDGSTADSCDKAAEISDPAYEQLAHLIESRRSIRNYKKKPVERSTIQQILNSCRYAPTGRNTQPVKWIVALEPNKINELRELALDWMKQMVASGNPMAERYSLSSVVEGWKTGDDRIFRNAPMVVINHAPTTGSLPLESCIIAMTSFDLAASGLGLGACWAGLFMVAAAHHSPIKEALQIPADHMIYGAMAGGYPKYDYKRIPPRNRPDISWF